MGWLFFGGTTASSPENIDRHVADQHTDEEGNIVYTCSMHPSVRKQEPGNCPICGMDLVPVSGSGSNDAENPYALTMSKAAVSLAEVQTVPAERRPVVKQIRMPGKLSVDEREISIIPAHFPGRVERLFLNFTGAQVHKGDKLATVYSPELITAQKELLEAYRSRQTSSSLYRAARRKLLNWEIPEKRIDAIIKQGEVQTNFDILSRKEGYVMKRRIAVGDHIMFGMPMFEIADLSKLWAIFEAYESDLAGLREGDTVMFSVDAYPGEQFRGTISYIDPILSETKRTVSVRADVSNPEKRLKPGMLAEGILSARLYNGEPRLQVPKSAVLWTGERSLVYVRMPGTGAPTFEAREVVLGARAGDYYEIKSGIHPGEQVVVSGNFMIDSAAQLADKFSMMNRSPGQGAVPTHNHGQAGAGQNKARSMKSKPAPSNGSKSPEAFQQQLTHLTEAYLEIKDALVASDVQQAEEAAHSFQQILNQVPMSLLGNTGHAEWMPMQRSMQAAALTIHNSGDIAAQRVPFAELSESLIAAIKRFGIVGEPVYRQFCPMAQNNEGADWISKSQKIVNPYFGSSMPDCGETVEEI